MLTVDEIKTFIDKDSNSKKKKLAKVGQRYYEGEHDIRNYRIFFFNAEGELEEDKTKSNIKISHPFFTEQVDQLVQYILSGEEGFVRSDNPDLQAEMDLYFNDNEDFMAELYDILTGTAAKGFEYAYGYRNADDRLSFQCADSLGVVEVRATETADGCEYVIFHYIDRISKDDKEIRRIQVWNDKETHFFCQEGSGPIIPDASVKPNPRPHIVFKKDQDDPDSYFEGFGFIPFFRLDNGKKQFSGLKPIKDLIDDYDLMSCGLSNNIQDTNEALYVVSGFSGDNLDELMVNIKNKKHIGVDENGGVDIKTIDIPYEARQAKLELDEKNIYRFGQALNTAGLKDTTATTNMAIKAAYSLLDLRAHKMIIHLKQFMRKLLKPVLEEINDQNGKDYQQKDVYFHFVHDIPTNAKENAEIELIEAQRKQTEITTLLNLATQLDSKTQMQLICEQLDIDYNEIKDKLPKQEDADPYAVQTVLDAIQPEDETAPDGGDVIE